MRTQYTLTCQHCKRPFETRKRQQRFCSRACYDAVRPPTIVPRPCDQCGATMLLTVEQRWAGKRFCSLACRDDAHRRTDVRVVLESNLRIDAATGCWLWQGSRDLNGYGKVMFGGKTWRAHRLAYTYYRGAIPAGLAVCHTCDTPLCCNPDHHFLGTVGDNNTDRHRKGRSAHGERSGHAKLTADQVREIRALSAAKVRRADIADRFGVSIHNIKRIVARATWKHLA